MDKSVQRHLIDADATLHDALDMLNRLSGDIMTLIAVERVEKSDDLRPVGTVTDGDVRRALLRGLTAGNSVREVMHRDFKSLVAGDIDIEKLREYRQKGIALIPTLTPDGLLSGLIDTRVTRTILPLSAILMAGGKGERLRPLTLDCPKPLLEIGGRAIIDYNMANLARVGISDVTVMTNYLAPMLEEHFSKPVEGISAKCVREPEFLGTIGAASLVDHADGGDTLVMNSDLLTNISLEDMYLTHRREKADITIAAVPYTVSVPYAILSTSGARVKSLDEKPTYTYYANAGVYIFSNSVLAQLPKGVRTDAPDLIEKAIAQGLKVVYFPIEGTWIDIGSPADFAHARELMEMRNCF